MATKANEDNWANELDALNKSSKPVAANEAGNAIKAKADKVN